MAMKDLTRVENRVWIESVLDLAHQIDGAAKFLLEKRHLALPDTMLAGACLLYTSDAADE